LNFKRRELQNCPFSEDTQRIDNRPKRYPLLNGSEQQTSDIDAIVKNIDATSKLIMPHPKSMNST
jgi:hypothetical protein